MRVSQALYPNPPSPWKTKGIFCLPCLPPRALPWLPILTRHEQNPPFSLFPRSPGRAPGQTGGTDRSHHKSDSGSPSKSPTRYKGAQPRRVRPLYKHDRGRCEGYPGPCLPEGRPRTLQPPGRVGPHGRARTDALGAAPAGPAQAARTAPRGRRGPEEGCGAVRVWGNHLGRRGVVVAASSPSSRCRCRSPGPRRSSAPHSDGGGRAPDGGRAAPPGTMAAPRRLRAPTARGPTHGRPWPRCLRARASPHRACARPQLRPGTERDRPKALSSVWLRRALDPWRGSGADLGGFSNRKYYSWLRLSGWRFCNHLRCDSTRKYGT